MENIEKYRVINLEEKEEIDRLASNALKTLATDENEETSNILKKIDEFILAFDNEDPEDWEKYGYELGSLFGNLISKEYSWKWYWVEADEETYYCITSPNEKACCVCHNYFYSILTKAHSNNFRLLFNMIEKTSYPDNWKFEVLN